MKLFKLLNARAVRTAGFFLLLVNLGGCQFLCQVFRCGSSGVNNRALDWDACTSKIQPRNGLQGKARQVAYQVDIARSCTMRGADDCKIALAARHSVDSFTAATRLTAGTFTPAQYLAVSRDRARKRWAAEDTPQLAAKLCSGNDADGDFVPDDLDKCPNTPDLTATDDKGCTDSTLPPGPSAEAVRKILDRFHLMISPHCLGAPRPMPIRAPALSLRWKSQPNISDWDRQIHLGRVTNQPEKCPVWYQIEVYYPRCPVLGKTISLVFIGREETHKLLKFGSSGTSDLIEFTVKLGDPGTRGIMANYGGCGALSPLPLLRARAINGNGHRGPWSTWVNNQTPTMKVTPVDFDAVIAP